MHIFIRFIASTAIKHIRINPDTHSKHITYYNSRTSAAIFNPLLVSQIATRNNLQCVQVPRRAMLRAVVMVPSHQRSFHFNHMPLYNLHHRHAVSLSRSPFITSTPSAPHLIPLLTDTSAIQRHLPKTLFHFHSSVDNSLDSTERHTSTYASPSHPTLPPFQTNPFPDYSIPLQLILPLCISI